MTAFKYPRFEAGQTLTHTELNLARDFLDDQSQQLGKVIGFGVSCGLAGTIDGDELQISGGFAIDQDGYVLCGSDLRVDLNDDFEPREEFSFIDTEATAPAADGSGFTPVLVIHELEQPAPECEDDGCDTHSTLVCRTARIVWTPGRLITDDFQTEPLLQRTPLRVTKRGQIVGGPIQLRNAILARIGTHIGAECSATFVRESTVQADDPPLARALRAALINDVLFASLDLLRCVSLMSVTCIREEETPGVALGWLHKSATGWVWDCRYRHHWQPPTGLSLALLGGSCQDPCQIYVERIKALIETFTIPDFPPPAADPIPDDELPGKLIPCHGRWTGAWYDYRDCWGPWIPPEEVYEFWKVPWEVDPTVPIDDLLGPIDPGDPLGPWILYGDREPNLLGGGVVPLIETLGRDAEFAKTVLDTIYEDNGITPHTTIITDSEVAAFPGYHISGGASVGDHLVLVKSATGAVISTGFVAANATLLDAASTIPDAVGKATDAVETATGAMDLAVGFEAFQNDARLELDELSAFKNGLEPLWGDESPGVYFDGIAQGAAEAAVLAVDEEFDVRDAAIRAEMSAIAGDAVTPVAQQIDDTTVMVNEEVAKIRVELAQTVAEATVELSARIIDVESTTGRRLDGLESDFNGRIVEVERMMIDRTDELAESSGVAVDALTDQLGKATQETQLALERANTAQASAAKAGDRIDAVLTSASTRDSTRMNIDFNEGLIEVLDSLRGSIAKSATNPAEVAAALAEGKESFDRFAGSARAGAIVFSSEKTALAEVLDSIVEAAVASGMSQAEARRARKAVNAFKESFG